MSERNTIRWEDAGDGVVSLVLDDPEQSANTVNAAFLESLDAAVTRLLAERDSISGVVITSAKSSFFAGADLNDIRSLDEADAAALIEKVRPFKSALRQLELTVPMVAAIDGAALGGGLEIALSCHHRIVVDDPRIQLGLPEVNLGMLAGGGGVVRTVRMLGVQRALSEVLLTGAGFRPNSALDLGLIDELVPSADALMPAAKRWIAANPDARQPWDRDGYHMPGGTPSETDLMAVLPLLPAMLRQQLQGANYPAPIRIMATAVESAQVDFDAALEIETRYFHELLTHPVGKNMIQGFFFDMQRVTGERPRPVGVERASFKKGVVLGAGMMGAGIAYICAKAGLDVVLKDVTLDAAEQGKRYSEQLVSTAVKRGRMSPDAGQALLGGILPTADAADAIGCDFVIEAVFEDPDLKGQVFAEVEPYLADGALLCSNTSTLPITDLASRGSRSGDFIGTHFMSPVDKMPLVEVIAGAETTDATVARTLDLARVIRKTPIVVNDSRGFFTSRVIYRFATEALAMLAEGVPAPSLEQATAQAGYPVGVLQLLDEGNLETLQRVQRQNHAAILDAGDTPEDHPGEAVMSRMIELGRQGRIVGRGFYDYDDSGARLGLWDGLINEFPPVADPASLDMEDLKERLLFIESIEAVKCLDEGVLRSIAEGNVGSLMAIGYPRWTGGVLQYMNTYPGGLQGFVDRARELSERYSDRFTPPASLVQKAGSGGTYTDGEGS